MFRFSTIGFKVKIPNCRKFHEKTATDLLVKFSEGKTRATLKENEALSVVGAFGIGVLQHHVHTIGEPLDRLNEVVPKLSVIKGLLRYENGNPVTHKTEYKAVELAVPNSRAEEMVNIFSRRFEGTGLILEGLLFRQYVDYSSNTFGDEILLSAYQDPYFGPCVVVGFGGVMVDSFRKELKTPPFILPVAYGVDYFLPVLRHSFLTKTITGQLRGTEKRLDWEVLETAVCSFAEGIFHFSVLNPNATMVVEEIEVNPTAMKDNRLIALDSVLTVRQISEQDRKERIKKPLRKVAKLLQPRSIGLVGCSEKISSKTLTEKAGSWLFHRFAMTRVAERLIERTILRIIKGANERAKKPMVDKEISRESPQTILSKIKKRALGFFQRIAFQHQLNPCNYVLLNASETKAKIIPIHRRASSILGIPCVKTVEEMMAMNGGKPVDCMIVSVPAAEAVNVLDAAFKINATETVQLFSAGFGETGVGRHLQLHLEKTLHSLNDSYRPLINGPNTVGNWVSGPDSFNSIFVENPIDLMSSSTLSSRPSVALICQSGGFAVARLSTFGVSLHPTLAISVGNQMDLNVCDFLEHLLDNGAPTGTPFPDVVGIYLEGLPGTNNGIRLMQLVARARRERGLTVVIYKAGRTTAGMTAVASHTASLSTDYTMFERLLAISGAVIADSLEHFNLLVATAAHLGPKLKKLIISKQKPKEVGITGVTNSGFLKCAMADAFPTEDLGLETVIQPASLTEESIQRITNIFKRHKLTEVVEVGELLDVTPIMHAEGWNDIIATLLNDSNPYIYLFSPVITPNATPNPKVLPLMFKAIKEQYPEKPFVLSLESGSRYAEVRILLWQIGVPCFECADNAMYTICTLLRAWLRP